MKRIFGIVLTLTLTALSASAALGSSATGFGARAVGMGGAYTAIADDESAAYWNPAGVTQTSHFRFAAGGGYHGDFDKLKNAIEDIRDDQMPNREDLNGNYSLTALVGFTSKHLGLNVYSDSLLTTSESATQEINATMNNINYGLVTVAGRFGKSKKLSVGVNLKAVAAGYGEVKLPALPDLADYDLNNAADVLLLQAAADAYTASTAYNTAKGTACDLGFLYQLTSRISLGFTTRNLYSQVDPETGTKTTYGLTANYSDPNVPTLEMVTKNTTNYTHPIEIPKSYVLGLAFRPFKHTLLAADLENITDSANDQTRLHVGLEQTVLWNLLSLRLGYFTYKDDATFEDSTGYTAGVGFNLWIINCSVAGIKTDEDKTYIATVNIKF
jgi:hypothetical protein